MVKIVRGTEPKPCLSIEEREALDDRGADSGTSRSAQSNRCSSGLDKSEKKIRNNTDESVLEGFRATRPFSYTCDFGDRNPLRVIPHGAKTPSTGQWILADELEPTRELLENIMAGRKTLRVSELTQPSLLPGILPKKIARGMGRFFSRECSGFRQSIYEDIKLLARTPLGRELLRELSESEHSVVIRPTLGDGGRVKFDRDQNARRTKTKPKGMRGSGCTVYISRDLNDTSIVVYRKPIEEHLSSGQSQTLVLPTRVDEIPQPRFMILAHELIHAHRGQRGLLAPRGAHREDGYGTQEEFETIDSSDYKFTENKFRKCFEMPRRFGHFRRSL